MSLKLPVFPLILSNLLCFYGSGSGSATLFTGGKLIAGVMESMKIREKTFSLVSRTLAII
jgi:hypothetical protein